MATGSAAAKIKLIESTNALQGDELVQSIFPRDALQDAGHTIRERTHNKLQLVFMTSAALAQEAPSCFDQCLELIEQSSAQDYRASEMKWSTPKKRREMSLPDMRYLLLTTTRKENGLVEGFASFMFTYEDGQEVVYLYEIHLKSPIRGQGLGKMLLDLVESAGSKVGVTKLMLTVFVSNRPASDWYERCGYSLDDFSPGPRILRNGTIKAPSYRILSKKLSVFG